MLGLHTRAGSGYHSPQLAPLWPTPAIPLSQGRPCCRHSELCPSHRPGRHRAAAQATPSLITKKPLSGLDFPGPPVVHSFHPVSQDAGRKRATRKHVTRFHSGSSVSQVDSRVLTDGQNPTSAPSSAGRSRHTCCPSTREAEAAGLQVPGQPGYLEDTVSHSGEDADLEPCHPWLCDSDHQQDRIRSPPFQSDKNKDQYMASGIQAATVSFSCITNDPKIRS